MHVIRFLFLVCRLDSEVLPISFFFHRFSAVGNRFWLALHINILIFSESWRVHKRFQWLKLLYEQLGLSGYFIFKASWYSLFTAYTPLFFIKMPYYLIYSRFSRQWNSQNLIDIFFQEPLFHLFVIPLVFSINKLWDCTFCWQILNWEGPKSFRPWNPIIPANMNLLTIANPLPNSFLQHISSPQYAPLYVRRIRSSLSSQEVWLLKVPSLQHFGNQ